MRAEWDTPEIVPPSHLAIGCALRECLLRNPRSEYQGEGDVAFDTSQMASMVERWAVRGVEEVVLHYDQCVALSSASSRPAEESRAELSSLGRPSSEDYFVALAGVVRLLARPFDDLEALAMFLYFQPDHEDCGFREHLSMLTSEAHDYMLFKADNQDRWRRSVDVFDSVTLPAATHVQWLTRTPPHEFMRSLP